VPIVLKGAEVVACPETGSEQNILSKEVATQLGILDQLDSSRSGRFVLGNGKDVQSLGAVDMELRFTQEPEVLLKCMFHVFESLIRPAILGGVFLRQTETLTKHRQRRLRQISTQTSSRWQIMHIGVAREGLDAMWITTWWMYAPTPVRKWILCPKSSFGDPLIAHGLCRIPYQWNSPMGALAGYRIRYLLGSLLTWKTPNLHGPVNGSMCWTTYLARSSWERRL
jgi:hypothetical protein